MRIVYVLTTLAMGGTEKQVLAIAGRMAARGHTVALLVLKPQETNDCIITDLNLVHLDIGKNAWTFVAGLRRGLRFLRSFRPGLIHSHNFHGNMLARIMGLFYRRAKLVCTIHNVYEGGTGRMLAYRATDRLADRTTAVSAAVAERYVRLKAVPHEKCMVLTNGIDPDEFQPDAQRRAAMRAQMGVADHFVWLSVGRITAAKDLPNLLQAFTDVCRDGVQTQLWIAGEAPSGQSVSTQSFDVAMPHGAIERVRRLGLRRDIAALLDAADGFVLSSRWEGLPLALGEAMAMEKPVVATDVGGVRELVGEAGILVSARDPHALAGAMLEVMRQSPENRAALGRAARRRILAHFAMDAKADAWEALYQSVLGSPS
jgi:glycosyltransferase involved in cell wall biosynthesis